jgi:hypothetical protein
MPGIEKSQPARTERAAGYEVYQDATEDNYDRHGQGGDERGDKFPQPLPDVFKRHDGPSESVEAGNGK